MEYRKLGQFLLEDKLAEGGMGEIILSQTADGNRIVLKQILRDYQDDPDFLEMFNNEARLTLQLDHPNIVKAIRTGRIGRRVYLAFEYMDGHNLRRVLTALGSSNLKLSEPLAIFIIRNVLEGLAYAHEKKDADGRRLGIVHRDINPTNIFITYTGEVKIIDFGIAKATALESMSVTPTGGIKGKYSYMAPEQARGDTIDARADLYAVGAVLWELLTGQPLFPVNSSAEILARIIQGQIPNLKEFYPECDAELEQILQRSLHRRPKKRYASALQFRADLDRYMNRRWPTVNAKMLSALVSALFSELHPERVPKNDPLFASYYGLSLVATLDQSLIERGIELCERALKKDIFNPELYLNMGKAYVTSGDKRRALEFFRQGLSLDRKNSDITTEIRRMGIRRPPPLPFLSRTHPFNRWLGRLRTWIQPPVAGVNVSQT